MVPSPGFAYKSPMGLYVALLRGINVGGKNLINMPALRECFEAGGFEDVSTYIASGNVLFRAEGSGRALEARIEKMLTGAFDYKPVAVVRSRAQMRAVVAKAPEGFGTKPKSYLSDTLFLKAPLTAATAIKQVTVREGVDEAHAGPGVLYFARRTSLASKSHLNKVVALPIYKSMTMRSWTTTTRLVELMNA